MICTSRALRVCLLAGGVSSERAVSLASGRSVARWLEDAGHRAICIDPRPPASGPMVAGATSTDLLRERDSQFRPAFWHEVDWRGFDAVFLALHGGAGEDGTLQRYLERRGIAFTGPDSAAAKAAMSKSASKARFRAGGVPTPACRRFDRRTQLGELSRAAAELGYPLVVKPDSQGSSLGVSLVSTADDLPAAAHQALQCDTAGLLEAFIPGREFTLALVDRQPLPLVEVCCRAPIFSYAEKYDIAAPHYRFETGLPAEVEQSIVAAALAAAEALAADGLVRVDLRLDRRNRPWVLELNATPGMTETSLAPAAARQAGLDLGQLCDSLLQSCLQRRITV